MKLTCEDIFLAAVSSAEYVGEIMPGQHIQRVRNVSFFCLTRRLPNDIALAQGMVDASETSSSTDDPCAAIRKYMTAGSFYFSHGPYDITQRVQTHGTTPGLFHAQFLWNASMMEPIETFVSRLEAHRKEALECDHFFLYVIQGYVGVQTIPSVIPCRLAVVSRLSSSRAGTRFNARGIDDEGNAANFVETETVLVADDVVFAFTQVRGSVPVFWEQQGLQALNTRIQITRTGAASLPGFLSHMDQLFDEYRRVFVLDLLGTRDVETTLAQAYVQHLRAIYDTRPVKYHNFDFHGVSKAMGGIEGVKTELDRLNNVQTQRQYNRYALLYHGKVLERQTGVFRINCFDCLDRTNVVEGMLSQAALRDFFRELKYNNRSVPTLEKISIETSMPNAIWQAHRELWANNGDALSVISTGTGSLNSNFMRTGTRKGLTGLLSDAAKSASRMYVNNFQDQSKQEAIDTLLGARSGQRRIELYDPRYARVSEALDRRWAEYASVHSMNVFVGTYNVCARAPQGLDMRSWLCPSTYHQAPADIVAIVLEELVPLNAQQLLQSAKEELESWKLAVTRTLESTGVQYELLRHELLFGTALLVLVKSDVLPHVKNVEGTTKKTGFRGMSGNKGGVAVRLDLFDTSVCFVGSHLPSGASNYEDRNADYAAIERNLVFMRGRTIESHDHIIWAGDLNYRIGNLSPEDVRDFASRKVLAPLLEGDQLTHARKLGDAFPNYDEAPIQFPPTYKYDIGSDIYDTSEKLRPPAWTDRILFKCKLPSLYVRTHGYDCAPIRVSDHRPVYVHLELGICTLDSAHRDEIYESLVNDMKEQSEKHGDEITRTLLPPPSTDTQQWWNKATDTPLSSTLGDDKVRGNPFLLAQTGTAAPTTTPVCSKKEEVDVAASGTSPTANTPLSPPKSRRSPPPIPARSAATVAAAPPIPPRPNPPPPP